MKAQHPIMRGAQLWSPVPVTVDLFGPLSSQIRGFENSLCITARCRLTVTVTVTVAATVTVTVTVTVTATATPITAHGLQSAEYLAFIHAVHDMCLCTISAFFPVASW
jgi:hypothetical protein